MTNWWNNDPGEDISQDLVSYIDSLMELQQGDRWKDSVHESIYAGDTMTGSVEALKLLSAQGFTAARLNVTRSIVQTIVSKLGIKRPAIKVAADDVDYSLKQRARALTRVMRGSAENLRLQRLSPLVIRDACVVGTGATYVGVAEGKIVVDRTLKEELYVDPREARYGTPRSLFRTRLMAREVLAERFPDFQEEIEDAPVAELEPDEDEDVRLDDRTMIRTYEAWHLPSGENADDGRYACCISGATLAFEEFSRQSFPFSWMHYEKPRKGFWGRGVVEDLAGIQWKIDESVRDIQAALYFGAQLRIWVPKGAPYPKSALGRLAQPSILEHAGLLPKYDAPNPVSQDQLAFLERLIQLAHDLTGVSQMAAQAKNPLGANASGLALQEFYDIQSERYSQLESMVTDWWVDTSALILQAHKEIAGEKKDHKVKWCERSVIHQIPWEKVELEDNTFQLSLEPTNFLPDTRAGKLETAEKLAQAGILVGPELSAVLGGFPDLERVNRLRNAPYEVLEAIMEKLADPEIPFGDLVPDAFLDFELGLRMGKAELARAQTETPPAPEEILQRFRDWIVLLTKQMDKAAPLTQPQPAGSGAMPPPPMPGAPPGPPGPPGPPALPPMPGIPPGVLP